MRWLDRLTAGAFCVAISLPGIGMLVSDSGSAVLREFRKPAPAPEVPEDLAALERWPRGATAWFGDHFALRASLIRLWNRTLLLGLGVSPTPLVVRGEDDWLFLGAKSHVDFFRAADPFTEEELEHWRLHLENKRDWLAERGIPYLFVLAPNKSTIYPERMPAHLFRVGERTRADQLIEHLAAHSDVDVLDLRPVLRDARERLEGDGRDVYFPLGSHWNDRGAFFAYRHLVARMGNYLPELKPLARRAFDEIENPEPFDNWTLKLHLDGLLEQEDLVLVRSGEDGRPRPTEMDGGLFVFGFGPRKNPRVFVLRDSFFDALGPLVGIHVSKLVLCTNRVARQENSERIPLAILREGPDLVVDELVERALQEELPPLGPWPDFDGRTPGETDE